MILWILHPFMVYRMKILNAIDIKGYMTTDIYADMSCTRLINDLECVRMNRSYKNQRDGAEYYQMNIHSTGVKLKQCCNRYSSKRKTNMFMNDTYKKQFIIQYDLNDEYAFRFLYSHLHEHYDITYDSLGGIIDNRRKIDMFDKKNNEFTRSNSEISLSECSGCPSLTNTVSPREKNSRSSSNGYFTDDFALINNNMIGHGRSRCMNDQSLSRCDYGTESWMNKNQEPSKTGTPRYSY